MMLIIISDISRFSGKFSNLNLYLLLLLSISNLNPFSVKIASLIISPSSSRRNNLINFYKEIKLKKFDLIYSVRKIKQKNFFNNFLKIIFINLFRLIHKNVYFNQSWLRIFNKKYKNSILGEEINYYPIGHELSKNFFIKKLGDK